MDADTRQIERESACKESVREKVGQSCVESSALPSWQKSSCPEPRQTLSTAFISTVTKFIYIYCLDGGVKVL